MSLPHLQISDIHFKKAQIYSHKIQLKGKIEKHLICVFSEVEITMINLGLTSDGVCKPVKNFVKIFNFFEFQGIFWLYVLFDVDTRYPQVRQTQKIDQKKKNVFFIFVLQPFPNKSQSNPTVTGLSKLKRKKFVQIGDFDWIFDCKYSLFWGGYQIYQSEALEKSIKKKKFFYFFSWSVSESSARIHMAIRPTGKRITTFLSE